MRANTVVAAIVVLGGIGLVAGGLALYKRGEILAGMNAPAWEPVESIHTSAAGLVAMQRSLTAVGTVRARRHVNIATEVIGKVEEVGFESGQMVKQGQVLLTLDAATEEADLRAAEATLALGRANYERLQKAASSNSVSQIDIDRALAERDTALARVEQLKAMIDKRVIRAPFAGLVGLRDVHPGQHLAEGAMVTTLQGEDSSVHVDFSVPQISAPAVAIGTKVAVIVSGQEVPAEVAAIDAQVDAVTRNARIRAVASAMDGLLKPGMFVDVRVPLGAPVDVLTVPATAVRRAPFGDHVFAIEPSEKDKTKLVARQRFIKTGGAGPNGIIVLEGLKSGDRVATDGSFKLREGVSVTEAPPAGAPATSPAHEAKPASSAK